MFCRELATQYSEVRLLTGPLFLPQADGQKNFIHYEVIT